MGSAINKAKEVVPEYNVNDLGESLKQSGQTCVAVSIAYMAYIFVSKYYKEKNQQFKYIDSVEFQEYVIDYIKDGFYLNPDVMAIEPNVILQAVQQIAKTLNCDVISDKENTGYASVKELLLTKNTIHAVMVGLKINEKFEKFIEHFETFANRNTVFTDEVASKIVLAKKDYGIPGKHAVVIINCYDDENQYMKGANTYGPNFGDNGLFIVKYGALDWESEMYTFKKTNPKPGQFVFDAVGKSKRKVLQASEVIGNKIRFEVPWNFTVGQVRQMISKKVGIKPFQIDLVYRGKLLEDDNLTKKDIKYTPFLDFRVFYHSYDNSKDKITLDGKKFVNPGIYKVLGAHPLTHKICADSYTLGIALHNPKNKTISYLGPFYNVPHDYNFNQISEMLKKYHNLSFNLGRGIFFKENPNKTRWLQIDPTFAMKYQIRGLHSIPYAILNLQS